MTSSEQSLLKPHCLVLGDELESVFCAVSAARLGVTVTLARRSTGRLGGLSTRGGLSYMDITPEYIPPLMGEFFRMIGFKRVALEPQAAHQALETLLKQSGVRVISGIQPEALSYDAQQGVYSLPLAAALEEDALNASHIIDVTPDADGARALGVPYLVGLGNLFEAQNFLGVSPVFTLSGVSLQAFQAFEKTLRQHPDMPEMLKDALPYKTQAQRDELILRPTYTADQPEQLDYLDVLNPAIGIYYHVWKGTSAASYSSSPLIIDGFNIALLTAQQNEQQSGLMRFNGLVARLPESLSKTGEHDLLATLLAYSHGKACPDFLLDELKCFERFLQEVGGFSKARVTPPEELYVRQTVTLLARRNMTAADMISGGVPEEQAIGTFSYWLDMRGLELWRQYPDVLLPKPVFNVGLECALPLTPWLENFAFIGRSAGYSPIGQGAGRIIQHNAMLGEAMGVATALSMLNGLSTAEVCLKQTAQVKNILDARNGSVIAISGKALWEKTRIAKSPLLKADSAAVETLRNQTAAALTVF